MASKRVFDEAIFGNKQNIAWIKRLFLHRRVAFFLLLEITN